MGRSGRGADGSCNGCVCTSVLFRWRVLDWALGGAKAVAELVEPSAVTYLQDAINYYYWAITATPVGALLAAACGVLLSALLVDKWRCRGGRKQVEEREGEWL